MTRNYGIPNAQRILGPAPCYTLWLVGCGVVTVSSVIIGILGNYYLFLDLIMNSNRIIARITLIVAFDIVVYTLLLYGAISPYRYFAKYAMNEKEFTLIMPSGKQKVYSWSSIAYVDIAFSYVNRQPRKYIRIFINKHRAKHRYTRYSCLEHYLMDQSSVIILECRQDCLDAIQQFIPIHNSIKKQ